MDEKNDEQTELLRAIWNEMKALGANLGGRIDATNQRIDATNHRLDATNQRIESAVEVIDRRFGLLEDVLRDLAGQQVLLGRFMRGAVDVQLRDLTERLARVEAKLAG